MRGGADLVYRDGPVFIGNLLTDCCASCKGKPGKEKECRVFDHMVYSLYFFNLK